MAVQHYFFILTFVLSAAFAQAAPELNAPIDKRGEITNDQESNPERLRYTSITDPPKDKISFDDYGKQFDRKTYYFPYRQSVSFHAGLIFGFVDSSDSSSLMNGLLGFSYQLPARSEPHWEAQVDLSFVGHGHLSVLKKHISNERGAFRPFYRYGVTHKLVPEEKAASFSNWENYLARLSVGFEDIRKPPRSVRLSLDAGIGQEDIFCLFTYGYSWGW